jgi:hypothetical protein
MRTSALVITCRPLYPSCGGINIHIGAPIIQALAAATTAATAVIALILAVIADAAQSNQSRYACRTQAYGYNLSFPSRWVIDIPGKLDFDFVFIDGEHGPFGLDQLEDLCRTAERHNLTTIAGVPDIGSSTIVSPHLCGDCDPIVPSRRCLARWQRPNSAPDEANPPS